MKKLLVVLILLACTVVPVAAIFIFEYVRTGDITVEIIARAPERGNFFPRRVTVPVGQKVKLRVRNVDTVTHGFAIPDLGIESGDIKSGHQVIEEFTPEKTGEYNFYCTAWCSEHHLQMRGVLEVVEGSLMEKDDR